MGQSNALKQTGFLTVVEHFTKPCPLEVCSDKGFWRLQNVSAFHSFVCKAYLGDKVSGLHVGTSAIPLHAPHPHILAQLQAQRWSLWSQANGH